MTGEQKWINTPYQKPSRDEFIESISQGAELIKEQSGLVMPDVLPVGLWDTRKDQSLIESIICPTCGQSRFVTYTEVNAEVGGEFRIIDLPMDAGCTGHGVTVDEAVLAKDWLTPEENEVWKDL